MLHAALVCPDGALSQELNDALSTIPDLEIDRTITSYPSPDGLLRTVRVRGIDLLFLCADDLPQAVALIQALDKMIPGLPIVTMSRRDEVDTLHTLMHLGVREHLSVPIQREKLGEAVALVRRVLAAHPLSIQKRADLCSFLPAKPGVGTSTIAVSTSCALAENLGAKALLLDCDLMAGTIRFLLNLGTSASIIDALAHAENLDEDLWAQMVGKWDGLEILQAGELEAPGSADLRGLEQVLSMARAQYEVICADLASSFDPFSVAVLRESQKIFLVTTPEILPLHMARMRIARLETLGLKERVSLILNRRVSRGLSDEEVAKSVGIPISYSLSNDYKSTQQAILDAAPIRTKGSPLGESILNLAHALAPRRQPDHAAPRRKFLEFFHVERTNDAEIPWRD